MNLQLKSMPEGRVHLNYSWAESTLQEHLLGKGRLHGVHRGKIAHVATMRTHGLQRAQHVQALWPITHGRSLHHHGMMTTNRLHTL